MKALKKLLKFVFGLIVTLVVVALLLVLTLPLWIGPVAKTAANRTVPGITGTDFRLGEFGLNYYTGNFRIGDVYLANPEGYSPKSALELGVFKVDVDVASLFEDTIVVHEIALRDVFVSYVKKDGVYNFDVIAENAKSATAGDGCEKAEEPVESGEPEEGGKEKASKKVVIDKIEISGITVQWGPIPVPVPFPIVIKDIGRESGGVDFDVAWREIYEQVMRQVGAIGQGLVNLGEAGLGVATNSLNAVTDVLSDSSAVFADAATNTVGALTGTLMDGASGAGEATVGALGTTADATMDALGSTADMTKDALGSTADATRDVFGATAGATKDALGATADATMDALNATGDMTKDAIKATGDTLKAAGEEFKSVGKGLKNMFKGKQ
jgi:hypothetical protein